jgi:hypothetical protein
MAVAIIMDFPGGTLEQYDQVIGKMGLEPGGDTPDGALFHWVAQTPEGLRVVDVWETQEEFDKFAAEQIGPYSQEAGLQPPQTVSHDVHNHFAAA